MTQLTPSRLTEPCQMLRVAPTVPVLSVPLTPPMRAGIYAVTCVETGLVKIGSSVNIRSRLTQLKHEYHLDLHLIAYRLHPQHRRLETWVRQQLTLDARRCFHPRLPGVEWCDLEPGEVERVFDWVCDHAALQALVLPVTEIREVTHNPYDGSVKVPHTYTPQIALQPGIAKRTGGTRG